MAPSIDIEKATKYAKVISSKEAELGGSMGVKGISGTVRIKDFLNILKILAEEAQLRSHSVLMDIGCSTCRSLSTAVMALGLQYAVGIEFDDSKVQKAHALLDKLSKMEELRQDGSTLASKMSVYLAPIMSMKTLPPLATHFYVFWQGFNVVDKRAFGLLFRNSVNAKYIAIVQTPIPKGRAVEYMAMLGFGHLKFIASTKVEMEQCGSKMVCYIFGKTETATAAELAAADEIANLDLDVCPVKCLREEYDNLRLRIKNARVDSDAVELPNEDIKAKEAVTFLPCKFLRSGIEINQAGQLRSTIKGVKPPATSVQFNGVYFRAAASRKIGVANMVACTFMPQGIEEAMGMQANGIVKRETFPGRVRVGFIDSDPRNVSLHNLKLITLEEKRKETTASRSSTQVKVKGDPDTLFDLFESSGVRTRGAKRRRHTV